MKITVVILINLTLCFSCLSQEFKKLDSLLAMQLSMDSTTDGRWVYNHDVNTIRKINKPEANKRIPNFMFYKVKLTNYLGYHVYPSDCLILFDSSNSKILLVQPIWYADISENFLKLFIGMKFDNSSLKPFIAELQDLLIVGSRMQFNNTQYTNANVTFDLINEMNGKKDVWRNFEVKILNDTIQSFKSTNPVTGEITLVK